MGPRHTKLFCCLFWVKKKLINRQDFCSVENSDNKNPRAGKFFSFFITFHIFNIFLPIYIRICKAYTKFDIEFLKFYNIIQYV